MRGSEKQIRRIDIIIEKASDTVKNPEGMTYIFHPFGVCYPFGIIYFYNHHTPSGLKFNCVTPNRIPFYSLYNADAFLTGDKLPNSGHVRATVSSSGIKIDYIRAFLPADEKNGLMNGGVAFSYNLPMKSN